MRGSESGKIFYVGGSFVVAFLNFFFVIGIIFLRVPGFLRVVCGSAGIHARAGHARFFLGFLIVGLPFGLVAGAVIDRVGAKW